MSPFTENENENENDELSCYVEEEEDDDDGFNEDMEALRRACMLTGKDPDDINTCKDEEDPNSNQNDDVDTSSAPNSDSDGLDEDLELLRKIESQFSNTSRCEPLSLKPLSTLLPTSVSDEEEDDYQTLLAIRKRFAAYENGMPYAQCPFMCLYMLIDIVKGI